MKVHQNKTNLIKITLRKTWNAHTEGSNSSARAIVLNIITYPTDINWPGLYTGLYSWYKVG